MGKRLLYSTVALFALFPYSHRPVAGQVPDSLAPQISLPVNNFAFWVGDWSVTVRTPQTESSGQPNDTAAVKVYSVLNGKAELGLLDSPGRKGFSLVYFDPSQNAWAQWLDWPTRNTSGFSSQLGNFLHGRVELFGDGTAGGDEATSRYTFSDITRTTLRWDEATSSDGGRTWSTRWIMEFTRMANATRFDNSGGLAHTFGEGDLCDLPQFRTYEFLSGPWSGTMESGRQRPAAVTGYRVLGGCSLLLFAGVRGLPETSTRFAHLTWNTGKEKFELLQLVSDSTAPAELFFGDASENGFVFYDREQPQSAVKRVRIERTGGGNDSIIWTEEQLAVGDWSVLWSARVDRFVPGRD